MNSWQFMVLLFSLLMIAPSLLQAMSLKGENRIVPQAYRSIAHSHQVPYKILYSVAMAESAYKAPSNGQVRPWPWTLNVEGKARRFNNKASAYHNLQQGLLSGKTNIDIGIGQINYRWNKDMFTSLSHALDPSENLSVASKILRREMKHCKPAGWWCAVGRYHSPGSSSKQRNNARKYVARVKKIWEQLH